jgi:anti-anti-sigma factor
VLIEWREERTVLSVAGDIDLNDVEELGSALREAAAASNSPVLDMREVSFMGSEGLRTIISAVRDFPPHVALTILPSRPVKRLLDVTGVPSVLTNLRVLPE